MSVIPYRTMCPSSQGLGTSPFLFLVSDRWHAGEGDDERPSAQEIQVSVTYIHVRHYTN